MIYFYSTSPLPNHFHYVVIREYFEFSLQVRSAECVERRLRISRAAFWSHLVAPHRGCCRHGTRERALELLVEGRANRLDAARGRHGIRLGRLERHARRRVHADGAAGGCASALHDRARQPRGCFVCLISVCALVLVLHSRPTIHTI